MRRILSVLFVAALAALALCACGGKQSGGADAHACDGKWSCAELPSGMSFEEVTLEINNGSFTYTLTGESTSTVVEGTAKTTGNDSMVLYMDKQKQINNDDKKVVRESQAEKSESDAQPVYIRLNGDGTLDVSGNQMQMTFRRMS